MAKRKELAWHEQEKLDAKATREDAKLRLKIRNELMEGLRPRERKVFKGMPADNQHGIISCLIDCYNDPTENYEARVREAQMLVMRNVILWGRGGMYGYPA